MRRGLRNPLGPGGGGVSGPDAVFLGAASVVGGASLKTSSYNGTPVVSALAHPSVGTYLLDINTFPPGSQPVCVVQTLAGTAFSSITFSPTQIQVFFFVDQNATIPTDADFLALIYSLPFVPS